jgi:hypothetical protein
MKKHPILPVPSFMSFVFSTLLTVLRSRKKLVLVYLFSAGLLFTGCYLNFYKTNTQPTLDKATIESLQNKNRYFIGHLKDGNYALKNISINNNLMEADAEPLAAEHTKYLNPDENQGYMHHPGESSPRYKKKDEVMLSEVHIYAETESLQQKPRLSIPLASVKRVDVYEKDIPQTRMNHIGSTVGITVTAGVAILVGALAIACNCPQVYTYEGGRYQFKSGVFSGAVYSSLERTDYLPLGDLQADNDKFLFRLMNNQQEEQFVNQLQLVKVSHDPASGVLIDRHGKVQNYKEPIAPATTSITKDEPGLALLSRDGRAFNFDEKGDAASDFGSVILTFNKPAHAKQAKLIVNAKNSAWAGYLFETFSSLFGDKSQAFIAKEDREKKQKIERWQQEQALPLMVYIETDKGWQVVDYFPTTGNTAARDMIIAIGLPETNKDKVRIKLETAFKFWELDYAAMDFSADAHYQPEFINVSAAAKSNSPHEEEANLLARDDQYSRLLQGEYISAEFKTPPQAPHQVNSYFLSATGYYHSLKSYNGKPDIAKLRFFRKKGAFNQFSEDAFSEAQRMIASGTKLQSAATH